ncbi:hypothetical protein X801_10452, partial [Opisthorchis viverrini]
MKLPSQSFDNHGKDEVIVSRLRPNLYRSSEEACRDRNLTTKSLLTTTSKNSVELKPRKNEGDTSEIVPRMYTNNADEFFIIGPYDEKFCGQLLSQKRTKERVTITECGVTQISEARLQGTLITEYRIRLTQQLNDYRIPIYLIRGLNKNLTSCRFAAKHRIMLIWYRLVTEITSREKRDSITRKLKSIYMLIMLSSVREMGALSVAMFALLAAKCYSDVK